MKGPVLEYTLPGVLSYLTLEFTNLERFKIAASLEKSELQFRIAQLTSEVNLLRFLNDKQRLRIAELEGGPKEDVDIPHVDLTVLRTAREQLDTAMRDIVRLLKPPQLSSGMQSFEELLDEQEFVFKSKDEGLFEKYTIGKDDLFRSECDKGALESESETVIVDEPDYESPVAVLAQVRGTAHRPYHDAVVTVHNNQASCWVGGAVEAQGAFSPAPDVLHVFWVGGRLLEVARLALVLHRLDGGVFVEAQRVEQAVACCDVAAGALVCAHGAERGCLAVYDVGELLSLRVRHDAAFLNTAGPITLVWWSGDSVLFAHGRLLRLAGRRLSDVHAPARAVWAAGDFVLVRHKLQLTLVRLLTAEIVGTMHSTASSHALVGAKPYIAELSDRLTLYSGFEPVHAEPCAGDSIAGSASGVLVVSGAESVIMRVDGG